MKELLRNNFDRPHRVRTKFFNGFLTLLILISIAALPLYFLLDTPTLEPWRQILISFEKITVTIFTIEIFIRVFIARKQARYFFSWDNFIDIIAILPFYLAQLGLLGHPELFLVLRVFRLLKLTKMYDIADMTKKHSSKHKKFRYGTFQLMTGESILKVVQKHNLFFLSSLLLPLTLLSMGLTMIPFFGIVLWGQIVIAILIICALFFFTKAWIDHLLDIIFITDKRIIVQNAELFGAKVNAISYNAINNLIPNNRGLWCWVFGYGTLHIETAASAGTLDCKHIPEPHRITQIISKQRQKFGGQSKNSD